MENKIINQQAVDLLTAPCLLENYFAGIIHMPGKGVTEQFSENTNAGYIRIVRELPPGIQSRRLGANVNGGNFNGDGAKSVQSYEEELQLTDVYDGNIDIPEVSTDMFSLDLIEAQMRNVAGEVSTAINAATIAEQLKAWANSAANNKAQKVVMPETIGDTSYRDAVVEAGAILDDGDEEKDVQTYPTDFRQLIGRPTFIAKLHSKNNLPHGDLALQLLARGVISEGTYKTNGNLYVGEMDGTPVYKAPSAVWTKAAAELLYEDNGNNVGASSVKNTSAAFAEVKKIEAMLVCGIGTARGVASGNRVKSIPCPRGAGITLQPKFRWGVECFYGTSVVPIVDNGFDLSKLVTAENLLKRVPVGSQG